MYCSLSSKIAYFGNNLVTDNKLIISSCSFRRMRAHSRNIYCLEYCIKTCSQHFFTTTFHFQNLTEWTVAMILSIFCNYLLQQEKKLVYSMIIISRIEYKFKCQNAIRVAHTQKKQGLIYNVSACTMVAAPCIGIVKKFSSQAKSRALAKARLMNWSSPVAQWVQNQNQA